MRIAAAAFFRWVFRVSRNGVKSGIIMSFKLYVELKKRSMTTAASVRSL